MKVLVIGASGYIGQVVCEKLKIAGYEVYGLARSEKTRQKLAALGYESITGDLTDSGSLIQAAARCDAVIHVAGLHGDGGKLSNEDMYRLAEIDQQSVRDILDSLIGTDKKFIHTTGATLFADMAMGKYSDSWHDENTDYTPPDFMQDRYQGEQYFLARNGEHQCNTTIIRPAIVYGRGGSLPITTWLELVKSQGISPYVGMGENRVGLVHVDDLADLYVCALAHAGPQTAFNAAGEFLSGQDLASIHSQACGLQGTIESWSWDQMLECWPFINAVLISVNELMRCDRAREDLKWNPSKPDYRTDVLQGSYRADQTGDRQ